MKRKIDDQLQDEYPIQNPGFLENVIAAEQGHVLAQSNLGFAYQYGMGVSQDLEAAAFWYQKAAEQGNALAQNTLGDAYLHGKGVPQNLTEAIYWYIKAAAQGDVLAQINLRLRLGFAYQYGMGVSQDIEAAAFWYQKEANQGNATAQPDAEYSPFLANQPLTEGKNAVDMNGITSKSNESQKQTKDIFNHKVASEVKSPKGNLQLPNKIEVVPNYLYKTGISPKYFGATRHVLPSGVNKGRTGVAKNKVILSEFKQLNNIETGHSPCLLKQQFLTIDQNEFSYITNESLLPSRDTRCFFVMAGRNENASIPCHVSEKYRTILVITQDELESFFLTKKERVWLVDKEYTLTLEDRKNATVLVQCEQMIKQYNAQGACVLTLKNQQQLINTAPKNLTQSSKIQISINQDNIDFHRTLDIKLKNYKGTPISGILLPDRTDLLVIKQLTSNAYDTYDKPSLVNARRVAALCFALYYQINDLMMIDDNIHKLHSANGAIKDIDGLWEYWENTHKSKHILSSVFTVNPRHFTKHDDGLGSKLFLINAKELRCTFHYIKPAELAFFLFLPSHLSDIPMEDYYFQLLVKHGSQLNPTPASLEDHAFLDSDTVALTRLRSNRNKAQKSLNSFGAFCWLGLSEHSINGSTAVDAIYIQNEVDKSIIKSLVEKASNDLVSIIKSNIITQHQQIINCQHSNPRTLDQLNYTGDDLPNMRIDIDSLWYKIKVAPGLNLRDPQIKAIEAWFLQKQSRTLTAYSIATGAGKTHIKAILAYLQSASTGKPVLVVTADKKLVEGLTEKFKEIFNQLKGITGCAIAGESVIPIMSGGQGVIGQQQLSDSKAFAYQQNIYVFCQRSFQKFIQEKTTDLDHINMILFDEYHCYNDSLNAVISYLHGFTVHIGNFAETDKFEDCYCIDIKKDTIAFWDAKANKRILDGKPTTIFSPNQIAVMEKLVQRTSYIQLKDDQFDLTADFQKYLTTERDQIPLLTTPINQVDLNETYNLFNLAMDLSIGGDDSQPHVPLFVGRQLSASNLQWSSNSSQISSLGRRGTYFNPKGIHQTNQYGLTQLIIRQEDNDYKIDMSGDEMDNGTFHVFELPEDAKSDVNKLILKNKGIPCIEPLNLTGCFILTNKPPQFIYKDLNGDEHEIARGLDVYQAWGIDLLDVQDEMQQVELSMVFVEKVNALNKLIVAYQLRAFPSVKTELHTNLIGFSATPPEKNHLHPIFSYNKEQAEQAGYIVPTVVRLMNISLQKPVPYKEIFKDILAMKGPNGDCLHDMKGIYRFKSIKELQAAELILKNMGNDKLKIVSLYTQKGSSYTNEERQNLECFSTMSYNQGAVLLVVSKLQKGWDEPKLRYTVDFKHGARINSVVQFSGRASRVYEDKKGNNGAPDKIGLSFLVSSNNEVNKHLEKLKTPLPYNKCLSRFFSNEAQGKYIKEGNYNLRSTPNTGSKKLM